MRAIAVRIILPLHIDDILLVGNDISIVNYTFQAKIQ